MTLLGAAQTIQSTTTAAAAYVIYLEDSHRKLTDKTVIIVAPEHSVIIHREDKYIIKSRQRKVFLLSSTRDLCT